MKVYIVSYQYEDGEKIPSAWSSEEKAEEYMHNHTLGDWGSYNKIVDLQLDEATPSGETRYMIYMDKNGKVIGEPMSSRHDPERDAKELEYEELEWSPYNKAIKLVKVVLADRLDQAMDIVQQRVTDIIAAGEWHVTDL